jgi:hypothetical protein
MTVQECRAKNPTTSAEQVLDIEKDGLLILKTTSGQRIVLSSVSAGDKIGLRQQRAERDR